MKLSFVKGKFMVRELGSLPRSRTFLRTIPRPPRSLRSLPPATRGPSIRSPHTSANN